MPNGCGATFGAYETWSSDAAAAPGPSTAPAPPLLLLLLLLLFVVVALAHFIKVSCCCYLHAKRFAAEVDKWIYFDFIAKNRWGLLPCLPPSPFLPLTLYLSI